MILLGYNRQRKRTWFASMCIKSGSLPSFTHSYTHGTNDGMLCQPALLILIERCVL